MNVNLSMLRREVLRVRLALGRVGTGALIAGALLSGAAALWAVVLPRMSVRVAEQSREVALARAVPLPKAVVSAPALASQRLDAFYAALGDGAHTEQIVSELFDAASETGVELDRAEYKPAHDAAGRFDTYTVVLPLKGDYSNVRRFSEKVLVALPYAALDDMRFKRNSAGDPVIEANLRFTAFLRPAVWASRPVAQGIPASTAAGIQSQTSASAPAPASTSPSASASTSPSGMPVAQPALGASHDVADAGQAQRTAPGAVALGQAAGSSASGAPRSTAGSSSVFVSGAITVPSRTVEAGSAITPAAPALVTPSRSVVPSIPAAIPMLPLPSAMALATQSAIAARSTSAGLLSASSQQPVLLVRAASNEIGR